MDIPEEVRKLAIQNSLSCGQIMALETLKPASSVEYQKVTALPTRRAYDLYEL